MSIANLVDVPMNKEAGLLADAGRTFWRYARRPLLGTERAAAGAERQLGQMSAKAEQNVANQVTRSGMSRDTHNQILDKWMGNTKDVAAGTTYNPFTVGALSGLGVGGYKGYQDAMQSGDWRDVLKGAATGTAVGAALGYGGGKALKYLQKGGKTHKELYESYQKASPNSVTSQIAPKKELMTTMKQFEQGTGKFKNTGQYVGTRAERIEAQRLRDLEASFSGFGKDQQTLFNLEKEIAKAKKGTEGSGNLDQLLAQRAEILGSHGKGLLGQKANYAARRAADVLLERGQFNTIGERLRFGRLGGAYIGGRGLEVVGARARQGGLFGKGGLIRGSLAWDPRIRMNIDMARHAAAQGQYAQAAGYGANAAIGTGVQGLKFGLMGGMPAYGVYDAMTTSDPNQSMLRRVGGAFGRGFGMSALMPLGALTWAGSMAPGMEAYSASEQVGRGLEYLADATTGQQVDRSKPLRNYAGRGAGSTVGADGRIYHSYAANPNRRRLPAPRVPNYRA